jgi:CTP:molybdopterin cytidylyltransferase MocA
MKKVTVAYRVDDVVVRRSYATAAEALAVASALAQMHTHWVLVRDRQSGGSWTIRASGRKS